MHDYIDMGYQHIALGGLVPKPDFEIMGICCAVRGAVETRTRTEKENVWLHLFGILPPRIQSNFRLLGVSSFDRASYLRKAWLRSDQNYLAGDGSRWYSTIRVPISSSKRLREAAEEKGISEDKLRIKMESRCLVALRNFNAAPMKPIKRLSSRSTSTGRYLNAAARTIISSEKHNAVLTDRPWEKCRCPDLS